MYKPMRVTSSGRSAPHALSYGNRECTHKHTNSSIHTHTTQSSRLHLHARVHTRHTTAHIMHAKAMACAQYSNGSHAPQQQQQEEEKENARTSRYPSSVAVRSCHAIAGNTIPALRSLKAAAVCTVLMKGTDGGVREEEERGASFTRALWPKGWVGETCEVEVACG
jgi:hypothetical protein